MQLKLDLKRSFKYLQIAENIVMSKNNRKYFWNLFLKPRTKHINVIKTTYSPLGAIKYPLVVSFRVLRTLGNLLES